MRGRYGPRATAVEFYGLSDFRFSIILAGLSAFCSTQRNTQICVCVCVRVYINYNKVGNVIAGPYYYRLMSGKERRIPRGRISIRSPWQIAISGL